MLYKIKIFTCSFLLQTRLLLLLFWRVFLQDLFAAHLLPSTAEGGGGATQHGCSQRPARLQGQPLQRAPAQLLLGLGHVPALAAPLLALRALQIDPQGQPEVRGLFVGLRDSTLHLPVVRFGTALLTFTLLSLPFPSRILDYHFSSNNHKHKRDSNVRNGHRNNIQSLWTSHCCIELSQRTPQGPQWFWSLCVGADGTNLCVESVKCTWEMSEQKETEARLSTVEESRYSSQPCSITSGWVLQGSKKILLDVTSSIPDTTPWGKKRMSEAQIYTAPNKPQNPFVWSGTSKSIIVLQVL